MFSYKHMQVPLGSWLEKAHTSLYDTINIHLKLMMTHIAWDGDGYHSSWNENRKHATCHSCHKDFLSEAIIAFSTGFCCCCWNSISWFSLNKSIIFDEFINSSKWNSIWEYPKLTFKISLFKSQFIPMSLFSSLSTFVISPRVLLKNRTGEKKRLPWPWCWNWWPAIVGSL